MKFSDSLDREREPVFSGPGSGGIKMGRYKEMVLLAALISWAVWIFAHSDGNVNAWILTLRDLSKPPSGQEVVTNPILPFRLPLALLHHALILAAGVLIAFGFANAGATVLRLFILSEMRDQERVAIGVLLGFIVIGAGYFGLALTGLFYPALLFVGLGAALVIPGIRRRWRDPRPSIRMDAKMGWLVFASIPGLFAFIAAFLPDSHGDVFLNHLCVPEQLLRVHRFSSENISIVYQYPHTAEFIYALGVFTGEDAVVHLIQLAPFLAAVMLIAGWSARQVGGTAGWITVGLIASFGLVDQMMIVAKNDLAAAAYPVAGAVCITRGLFSPSRVWLVMGMLLLGCGAAVKVNNFAFLGLGVAGVVLTAVLRRRSRLHGFWLWAGGLALLPFLPWLVKTWLMTGDPVWPLLAKYLPGAFWDAESGELVSQFRHRWAVASGPLVLPVAFVRVLIAHQPAVACALPLIVAGLWGADREFRWMTGFLAVSFIVLWGAFPLDDMRFALPLFVLLSACTAAVAVRWGATLGSWTRRGALLTGMAAGWLPLGMLLTVSLESRLSLAYLSGAIGREEYLAVRLTTYWQARKALMATPDLGRLAGLQTSRSYLFPGRFLQEWMIYHSWSWTFSRDSATAEEVARKFRQLGCRHLIYDFMIDYAPDPVTDPFKWNDRMQVVWKDFVGRYLEVSSPPETVDDRNGGYCVYRVRRRPLARPPASLPYLPGIRSLYGTVTRNALTGDVKGWLVSALLLQRRFPDVDFVNDLVGKGYADAERWRESYEFYRPGVTHGTLGAENYWGLTKAAIMLGRWKEARHLIGMAKKYYPLTKAEARDPQGRSVDLEALIDTMIQAEKTGSPPPAKMQPGNRQVIGPS
jgi:hypothetical protein